MIPTEKEHNITRLKITGTRDKTPNREALFDYFRSYFSIEVLKETDQHFGHHGKQHSDRAYPILQKYKGQGGSQEDEHNGYINGYINIPGEVTVSPVLIRLGAIFSSVSCTVCAFGPATEALTVWQTVSPDFNQKPNVAIECS